jgi:tetratricopeptide (TPR) repeat protein/tRNA A-37 threonylcarbamoyl transferase component Bud32
MPDAHPSPNTCEYRVQVSAAEPHTCDFPAQEPEPAPLTRVQDPVNCESEDNAPASSVLHTCMQGHAHRPAVSTRIQHLGAAGTPGDTRVQFPAATPAVAGVPEVPGCELIAEVGRGGMGVVYKARQSELNRVVAIKMVLGDRYQRDEDQIRFRLEAETAARIHHPNVVHVYESGAVEGRPYLIFEWVDGGTLASYLKDAAQAPDVCARSVELLARAIHIAHCNGVVHRDLKPGNVLMAQGVVGSDGLPAVERASLIGRRDAHGVTLSVEGRPVFLTPKIADFGLAKQIVGSNNLTEPGRIMGTPEYMSPEQAEGRVADIGPATDIYALGVILYQMLTGTTPFRADSVMTVLRRVLEEEPAAPRVHNAKLPRDLETICLKCLDKEAPRRYATAAALADDLERFLQKRPIAARPTRTAERAGKWVRRHPGVTVLAGVAAGFFGLGVAGIVWQRDAAVAQRGRAEQAEHVASTEKATCDAVNRFLIEDLIETAAPRQASRRQAAVEQVLSEAADRAERAFADQPEVVASFRLALGKCYYKLGRYPEAAAHIEAAVALRREHLGPDHIETRAASAEHERLLAEANAAQVDAPDTTRAGSEVPLTLKTLGYLADVLREHGGTGEAESLFQRASSGCREKFGPDDPRTLAVASALGGLLLDSGRAADAEPHLKAVYKSAGIEGCHASVGAAQAAGRFGACLLAQKKYAEAEKPLLSSYRVLTQCKEAPPTSVKAACTRIVELYDSWGQPEKADEYRAKSR